MKLTTKNKPDMRYRRNRELAQKTWLAKYWLALIIAFVAIGVVVKSTQNVQEFLSPVPDEKTYPIPWPTIQQVIDETIDEVLESGNSGSLEPTTAPEIKQESKSLIRRKIDKHADAYGVDRELADCVVFRESSYNFEAIGDSGKAHGLAQFHLPTWKWMRGLMGKSTADTRMNPDDALATMCWGIASGYGNHWTPFNSCLLEI